MSSFDLVRADYQDLLAVGAFGEVVGGDLRIWIAVYLGMVILLLAASTSIRQTEGIGLRAILIAAFSWPVCLPVVIWKALSAR
jgi:hypothetical protein